MVLNKERLALLENSHVKFADRMNETLNREFDGDGNNQVCLENSKYVFASDLKDYVTRRGPQTLHILHLNCRGLNSSLHYISELCSDPKFEVVALTETWLRNDNSSLLDINGYEFINRNRETRQHGGLAVYIKSGFAVKTRQDICIYREMIFESMVLEISRNGSKFLVLILYKPPSASEIEFLELLEQQLEMLNVSGCPSFIAGDFNIDMMVLSNRATTSLLNLMSSFGLFPGINICTRICNTSASLIDNIFTNVNFWKPGVLVNDVSDHCGVFLSAEVDHNYTAGSFCSPIVPTVDADSLVRFKNELECMDWEFLNAISDPDLKFCKWYDQLCSSLRENCRMRKKKNKSKYDSARKPWITSSLLRSMKRRHELYKKSIIEASVLNQQIYRKYNVALNKLLRKARIEYLAKEFKKSEGNPAKTWSLLRPLIGKRRVTLPNLQSDQTPVQLSNQMCDYFSSVGNNVAGSIYCDRSDGTFDQYLPPSCDTSILMTKVTESEITEVIMAMKNKASGVDLISIRVLKFVLQCVIKQLVSLINGCFKSGVFPKCLKRAKIVPIFKGGDKDDISNYRPISLLPVIARIFEKLVYIRLEKYLEKNLFFYQNQFGFRKGYSSEHAMLFLTTYVNDALDNNLKVASIFLDIAKAFDTVSYDILLMKLENCGIRGNALKLLESFLNSRSMFVEVNDARSDSRFINCGVPQGSPLGPLLFSIYINDLSSAVDGLYTIIKPPLEALKPSKALVMFADDTKLTVCGRTENELMSQLREGFKNIERWMRSNRLKLNCNKSSLLIYSRSPSYYPWVNKLSNGTSMIPRKRSVRYLGIIIDETLSFVDHIDCVSMKLARNVGIMRKLKNFLPTSILRLLYFSIVHPYLLYCSSVWSSTFGTHLLPLRVLQNSAIRLLIGKDNRGSSVRNEFMTLKILPVSGLFKFYKTQFMFKYLYGSVPVCFKGMFVSGGDVHEHGTRNLEEFRRPIPQATRSFFSIRHAGPSAWNSLPVELKCVDDLLLFRSLLRSYCLVIYYF